MENDCISRYGIKLFSYKEYSVQGQGAYYIQLSKNVRYNLSVAARYLVW